MTSATPETHCGFVALVGRPNVGKSTLLNRLLGTKLSITSRKPQTTRYAIHGIKTAGSHQYIYVDTPGLQHQQKKQLHRVMNRTVHATVQDVDVVLMVVDALIWNEGDERVLAALAAADAPVILVINKIDKLTDKSVLLPHIAQLSQRRNFAAIVPVSAFSDKDVAPLEKEIGRYLPASPHLYAEDELTDRTERFLMGEMIREKIMRQLGDEIPYDVAVEIEQFQDKPALVEIHARILVEKEGQKKIVIGNQGSRLKQIGEEARHDMEALLQKKVLLKLWVTVKTGWADNMRALKSLGLE